MNHVENAANAKSVLATAATYATSGTLVAGSYMDYLNNHAGAFGVIIGVATFVTNFVFQLINRRALLKTQINCDDSFGG